MTEDTGSSSGIAIGRVMLAFGLVAASLGGGYLLISAPQDAEPELALDPQKPATVETVGEEDVVSGTETSSSKETAEETSSTVEDRAKSDTTPDAKPDTIAEKEETKTEPDQSDGKQVETVAETDGDTDTDSDAPELPSPSFDVVRIDSAGNAVVAGQASAGQTVHIYLDDEEVHSTTADTGGGFVGLFEIPPSEEGRSLTIEIEDNEGVRRSAAATALVSPFGSAPATVVTQNPARQQETDGSAAPEISLDEETTLSEAEVQSDEPTTAPTVLIVDEDGVRPVQSSEAPASPKAPDRGNVVIDTISYDAKGDVVLVGRGLEGALLRLYLNNNLWTSGEVASGGGWQVRLIDVDPGIYTLRVDEVDRDGRVTSRFETPFQREVPEVAVAALNPGKQTAPSRQPTPNTAPAPERHSGPKAAIVTVQPGFTLWGIATKRYGDGLQYVQVFEANRGQIRDPDLIYPGQVFALPED